MRSDSWSEAFACHASAVASFASAAEAVEPLSSARSETLDTLSTKFEGLLERLQTPAAREGMEAAPWLPASILSRARLAQTLNCRT
jgi:hypothetical protein